jgi:hypothetical protein
LGTQELRPEAKVEGCSWRLRSEADDLIHLGFGWRKYASKPAATLS